MKSLPLIFSQLFCFLCIAVISAHILVGYYAYPHLDDWEEAFLVERHGYWQALYIPYTQYMGRWAFIIVVSLINDSFLFPYYNNFVIMGLVALFFVSLALFISRNLGNSFRIACVDVAFLWLVIPQDIKREALYCQAFNVLYVLPITLTLFIFAFIGYGVNPKKERYVWLALFLAFVFIGGFNEPFPVLFTGCCGIYLLLNAGRWKDRVYRRIFFAATGMAVGFILNAIAPGNYIRLNGFASVFDIIPKTIYWLNIYYFPFLAAVIGYCVLRSAMVKTTPPPVWNTLRGCGFYSLVMLAGAIGSVFMVVYGYHGGDLPARSVLIACTFTFISALFISSWLSNRFGLFQLLRKNRLIPLFIIGFPLVFLLAKHPVSDGFKSLGLSFKHAPEQRRVAVQQIDMAFAAVAEGKESLELPRIEIQGRNSMVWHYPLDPDPKSWVNVPFKKYFGLKEVYALPVP